MVEGQADLPEEDMQQPNRIFKKSDKEVLKTH